MKINIPNRIQEQIDSLKRKIHLLRPGRFFTTISPKRLARLRKIVSKIKSIRKECTHRPQEFLVVTHGRKSTARYCSICGARCKTFTNKD